MFDKIDRYWVSSCGAIDYSSGGSVRDFRPKGGHGSSSLFFFFNPISHSV
jgi:hypothetical protein